MSKNAAVVDFMLGLAEALGWSRYGNTLSPPRPGRTIRFHDRQVKDSVFRSNLRSILKYGVQPRVGIDVTSLAKSFGLSDHHWHIVESEFAAYVGLAEPESIEDETAVGAMGDVQETEAHRARTEEPYVLTRHPYRSHRSPRRAGGATTYDSPAIVQVNWSDGRVSYECSSPGCDYVSDIPRSVSSHWANVHSKGGRAPQPDADGVDTGWVPTHRQATTIAKLAVEIRTALAKCPDADPECLARAIVEARPEHSGESGPSHPLTPEEILNRIAQLVDRGETPLLRERVAFLEEQFEWANEEVRRQTERADLAVGTVSALRDLLNEASDKE